jgi:vancomycin resistance protein YoaR
LNIHRIADLIQGQVIAPGATFSINDFVGPRTAAKGFVDAPVIDEHYNFSTDIGGGISQFATTIFNAAFFSGLDIPSYFMHGIYISRYPYGRESTISFPDPDVRIRNNTPYGVLIWPTYTDTSITVTMYSTKWVSGDQTGQTTTPKGPCTQVVTERTRTYVDGRKPTIDHFSGLYSPTEGVECP